MPAKKARHRSVKNKQSKPVNTPRLCEYCGKRDGLSFESSRTAYPWDGEFDSKDDPNRDKLLCRKCAKLHHEFWDQMWIKYRDCYLYEERQYG